MREEAGAWEDCEPESFKIQVQGLVGEGEPELTWEIQFE